jgi:hypothetical protein
MFTHAFGDATTQHAVLVDGEHCCAPSKPSDWLSHRSLTIERLWTASRSIWQHCPPCRGLPTAVWRSLAAMSAPPPMPPRLLACSSAHAQLQCAPCPGSTHTSW